MQGRCGEVLDVLARIAADRIGVLSREGQGRRYREGKE